MKVTAVADKLVISVEAHSSQAENIHYQVVHWIPGRFRILIPRLHEDEEYITKLKYVLDTIEFVTEVEINPKLVP